MVTPWVRFTPDRAMNKKLRRAGFAARGLDEAGICQVAADDSDGFISTETVETLAVAHREKHWRRLAAVLVTEHRWSSVEGGWQIHLEEVQFKARPLKRPWNARITPALRAALLQRDEHVCLRCGATDHLTGDHIIPVSRGGQTTLDNLQLLCQSCNSKKGVGV
ncbi:MAG: HNH endonuclease [Actinomycetota bacterium]|nr:HNH endonuclease [Actinomycetota bacterium]